jgi:hypothetical protein
MIKINLKILKIIYSKNIYKNKLIIKLDTTITLYI